MKAIDVVVIGAGLNGLVAAAALARRRLSVVVLDRRPIAGGAAITAEFAPGFRAPTLSHSLGPVHRDIVRGLRLDRAVQFVLPDPALTTLGRDGRAIVFHRDPVLTATSINTVSAHDATRWRDFLRTTQRFASLAASLNRHAPPSIDELGTRESWRMLMLGRRARRLGRGDLARVMRWVPMAVADLTAEWFENELLQAAVASRAVFGNPVGPWSAGTGGMLLQRLAEDAMPVGSGATARGGPGAVIAGLVKVATKSGVTLRTDSRVAHVMSRNDRVHGVVLDNGEQIHSRAVVAAIDPRQVFLNLIDPTALAPTFVERIRNYRARGVTAKINLALSRLPTFPVFDGDPVPMRGRFLVAPDIDYLERAFDATKYGQMSSAPWLELSLPSVIDSSLAPEGQHVMSICAHFAPRHLRDAQWSERRDDLYEAVLGVLEAHVPKLADLIVGRELLTPEDLEQDWGLSGGHIFHGESALDQSWIARPLLGWAQYRMPLKGLYLAGAGAHPGGGLTGLPGLLAARTVIADARKNCK